ncbi:MAG: hypothetical protein GX922_01470 [Firmicutes bacterium]|mgnify:CR=1 FL=1|nr:hypothetical protein [Bacillota bacterium]
MPAETIVAYFYNFKDAKRAEAELVRQPYIINVKSYDAQLTDPDVSVSALMVGNWPNLAHGIFGTENSFVRTEEGGVYLLIVTDEEGHESEVRQVVENYGGSLVQRNS